MSRVRVDGERSGERRSDDIKVTGTGTLHAGSLPQQRDTIDINWVVGWQ